MGKEIRILLNESTFTQLCKTGFLKDARHLGKTEIHITKVELKDISIGNIFEKEVDGNLVKVALQDIGTELIEEIIKRSPIYSN